MDVDLPPLKQLEYDDKSIRRVYNALSSVIAGHPAAKTTYYFYEVIDEWLGPWGPEGYPLGYGKFYNIAFTTNEALSADPVASAWVWNTTVLLQEALRDYIISMMMARKLKSITEPELRAAAFASHAQCYTDGGLAYVVLVSPLLLGIVATIPSKEFNPFRGNFMASLQQVGETATNVAARMVLMAQGNVAGAKYFDDFTSKSGLKRDKLAAQRSQITLMKLSRAIDSGNFDTPEALDNLIGRLQRSEFPDADTAKIANSIIFKCRDRKKFVEDFHKKILQMSPPVKRLYEENAKSKK